MEDVRLSSNVSIADYQHFESDKNREEIAKFIQERFTERYINPLRGDKTQKHGFCTMAICCLMIEALESFYQGWPNTNGNSEKAFQLFFQRCLKLKSELGKFSGKANDFYHGVRCGILHQAETTNGWCISRKGDLFDSNTKTIHATKFHNELENVLILYCKELKHEGWNSEIWEKLREKMKAVINNCKANS
ncbi:MAG: hypothetical protein JXB48_22440 [Candidatus Latescibacteria bacterium]|nr:hypothetical protein [Candidatus Latescibacterota bacterium]